MEQFHGALLIGGMSLRDLSGDIENEPDHVCGRFTLDRGEIYRLRVGEPYRLELDDGRAMQVVVSRMDVPVGHVRMLIEFDGISPPVRRG